MLIFYKESHRDVRCHLIYSRYMYSRPDNIVAVEGARQGISEGEDTVSGFMCADDFVGCPKKRLPAIVDRAVWEKVRKRRAGIWWDSLVEKVWKDI